VLKSKVFRQGPRPRGFQSPQPARQLNSLHGEEHFREPADGVGALQANIPLQYEEEVHSEEDVVKLVRSALVRAACALIGLDLLDDEAVERVLVFSAPTRRRSRRDLGQERPDRRVATRARRLGGIPGHRVRAGAGDPIAIGAGLFLTATVNATTVATRQASKRRSGSARRSPTSFARRWKK
jgi:hypothetical protein